MDKEYLEKLIADATAEFQKTTEAVLAKSLGEDSPDEDSQGTTSDEGGAPEPESSETKEEAPAADAAPPVSPDPAPAPEAQAPEAGEGDILAAPTVEELSAEYSKLPDDQLDMHIQAAQMAKAAKAAPVAAQMAAPAPAAPPPAAAPAPGLEALKSEMAALAKEVLNLQKSLADKDSTIAAKDAELAKAEAIFKRTFEPVRKSFSSASQFSTEPKKEDYSRLTKSDVNSILCNKIKDGKLSKSEGKLAAGFAVGTVTFKEIEHLLSK